VQGSAGESDDVRPQGWPTVSVVFLVYNRRDELRTSLKETLAADYDPSRLEVIVVDNASSDSVGEMVRQEFSGVQLITLAKNVGVSGWNPGLEIAQGDFILMLDDDCYLPRDGLRGAVAAAEEAEADMVSFKVVATHDPEVVFTERHRMGLFMFWGCAVLVRRRVVEAIGGYDPEIFFLANELDYALRFFDRGFRHLHLPEVVAQHMKRVTDQWIEERGYRTNARNYAYIVGKLLAPRDAVEALIALMARAVVDGLRTERGAIRALPDQVRGFVTGLRHRAPLRTPGLSRFYRRNFETLASPWWLTRPPGELVRALPQELLSGGVYRGSEPGPPGRRHQFFTDRLEYYPEAAALLEFRPEPVAWPMRSSSPSVLKG
jgi:GT2 family glycosyltransferase